MAEPSAAKKRAVSPLAAYWAFLDSPRCQCKARLAHNCLGWPECKRPERKVSVDSAALSRLRAAIERFLSPGLGTCYRCNRPWRFPATRRRWSRDGEWKLYRLPRRGTRPVRYQLRRTRFLGLIGVVSHETPYKSSAACFPLCEGCWSALTPAERLPFYQRLVNRWIWFTPESRDEYEADRKLIYEAVLDGR